MDKGCIGRRFAAHSTVFEECRLVSDGERLEIYSFENELTYSCSKAAITIDPKLGSIDRKITLADHSIFETSDSDFVDSLDSKGAFWQRIARLESFGPHLIVLAIACVVGVFAVYRYGLPLLVNAAIAMTPVEAIEFMDSGTLRSLDSLVTSQSKLAPDRKDELQGLFTILVSAQNRAGEGSDKKRYQLLFRNSPRIGPNAFALPGGTIVMTDQLVKRFPDNELLAGVLAHELGHVAHQHSLKQLYRALGMAGLVALIAGDSGPILEDLILEGNAFLSLSFSRQHEVEADAHSVKLMRDSDMNPAGIIKFFEAIEKKYGGSTMPSWMSTHPATEDRINAIKKLLEAQ
jgi:Zn-dependent protease with chaperone function